MRLRLSMLLLSGLLAGACATAGPPRPDQPLVPEPYPVLLAHGLSGFRRLAGIDYFYQVPAVLQEHGVRVYVTHVPPWGPVSLRAKHLADQVEAVLRRTHAAKVHLIAHSMGGLDARYAISRLGLGDRVASLTTVATPHRGSVLADVFNHLRQPWWDPMRDVSADFWIWTLGGIKVHSNTALAVDGLSEQRAREFNREVPDDPRVRYYSFAGRTLGHSGAGYCEDGVFPNPAERDPAPPELLPTAVVLSGPNPLHPVANDGLVTVPSAKWGLFMGCLPASHTREVGHMMRLLPVPGAWDHRTFYLDWAQDLLSGRARTFHSP